MRVTRRFPVVVALALLLAIPASSQLDAIQDTMKRLRAGTWTRADLETVVTGLMGAEHYQAARWWLDHAEHAIERKRLPAAAKSAVSSLRKKVTRAARPTREEAKFAKSVAALMKTLVRTKDYGLGHAFAPTARSVVAAIPDRSAKRTLDGALAKLRGTSRNARARDGTHAKNAESVEVLRPACDETIRQWLARGLEEYEAAGCAPGREGLAAAVGVLHPAEDEEEIRERKLRRIAAATRRQGPHRKLQLCIGGRFNGYFASVGDEPIDLDTDAKNPRVQALEVVAGDVVEITLAGHRPRRFQDGTVATDFIGVWAAIDGKVLKDRQWRFRSDATKPGKPSRVEVASKEPWGEGMKAREGVEKTPNVLVMEMGGKRSFVPFGKELDGVERAFEKAGARPRWIVGRGERVTFLIEIPPAW